MLTTFQRKAIIKEENRIRIEKYITGIVQQNSSKLYAIYVNPEHLHVLVSRSPSLYKEELITSIADSSERFINQNNMVSGKFKWQQSASAFSVSKADVSRICKYILNQPEHHKRTTFEEEYQDFMKYYQKTINKKN